jgi:predicted HNH restriction endonuclease
VTFRRVTFFDIESNEAREGYEIDRSILTRARNASLASQRKDLDNYTCQACGFRLEINACFVVEVHHCDPLSVTGETDTTIEQLVSLCPTCHRIAHLRSTPYTVEEIKAFRSKESG